jgi:protein-S-isoprenylcysteine O-methyltransferase Ste14
MTLRLPTTAWVALALLAVFAVVELAALVRRGKAPGRARQELASMLAIGSCSLVWVSSVAEAAWFGGPGGGGALPGLTSWPGVFILALGVGLRAVAFVHLGRFYDPAVTLHDDHRLITTGLYHHARHPLYAGSLCLFLGFPLAFSSAAGLALFFALPVPVFAWRIRVEERALAERFGDAWRAYARKTPALFLG